MSECADVIWHRKGTGPCARTQLSRKVQLKERLLLAALTCIFSPTHNLISQLKYHIFVITFNSHVYWKCSNSVGKDMTWVQSCKVRTFVLTFVSLDVPPMQSSGKPYKMEFSVFCPDSSCVLRAEQLQPCTACSLAWLIVTPRTKELLWSTVIIHSLHSWGLRTRAIRTASRQQTTASCYWSDRQHFDNVKPTWLLLFGCCSDGPTVSMQST